MGFAERYGFKSARLEVQVDYLDDETRAALWNCVYTQVLGLSRSDGLTGDWLAWSNDLWSRHFGGLLNEAPRSWEQLIPLLQPVILEADWYDALDLMEALATWWPPSWGAGLPHYTDAFNAVAERHLMAYRFVGGEILRITDPEQVEAVDAAQDATEQVPAARTHLDNAIQLLNDRKNPNYAKSIAESMSAVEAVARQVTGDEKATLGTALKKLPQHHKALEDGWSKLYGFSSDEGGIRHATKENGLVVDQALALYFLVTCSAMVSYLLAEVQPPTM